jgi:hypothetical protein
MSKQIGVRAQRDTKCFLVRTNRFWLGVLEGLHKGLDDRYL